jgi:hypothetical protein
MNKIKSLAAAALIGSCSFGKAQAQNFDFLLKLPYNFNSKSILAEPTATYNLPGKIEGFTFVDLYKGSYFAQTDLTKRLGKQKDTQRNIVNIRSRTLHNNELHTATGLGINKDVNLFNNKMYLSASALPVWIDNKCFAKRQTVDYFFNVDLGKKWSFNGFGEWEHKNKKVSWVYGEFDFGKNFGKSGNLRFSYSPTINKNQEEKGIFLEHRLAYSYSFK